MIDKKSSVIRPRNTKKSPGEPPVTYSPDPMKFRFSINQFTSVLEEFLEANFHGCFLIENECPSYKFLLISPDLSARLIHGILGCVLGRDLIRIGYRFDMEEFRMDFSFRTWKPTSEEELFLRHLAENSGFTIDWMEDRFVMKTVIETYIRGVYQRIPQFNYFANSLRTLWNETGLPEIYRENRSRFRPDPEKNRLPEISEDNRSRFGSK